MTRPAHGARDVPRAAGGPRPEERPRLAVIGTPGDRRVTLFAAAARAAGLGTPDVIAWRDVLSGAEVRLPPGALVRIDSPGADPETDALLRGPGDPARVGGGDLRYRRLLTALERIRRAVADTPGCALWNDPDDIAVMFDKRRCHARLDAAGVPVPPALPGPVDGYATLRRRMREAGWSRVFVKPAHGSSASGVIALHAARDRVQAITSVAVDDEGGLYNSLRVRTYRDEPVVAAIVDALAPAGLHVERWFPKAVLDGRAIDLRVVVVAGRPTHAVVRASRTPMTNLHLGGERGDLDAVRDRLGENGWRRAMEVCAKTAACFPRSPMAGVDLMIGTGWREFAVAEVNAFGDLLPGLTGLPGGGAEGMDTYAAQLAARFAAPPPNRPWRAPVPAGGGAGAARPRHARAGRAHA